MVTRSANPFRSFDNSPEVIRLVVMMYIKYPLSLRNVEDLLFERGLDICHATVRLWWSGAWSWARARPGLGKLRLTGDRLPFA